MAMKNDNIKVIADKLWKEQSEANWEKLSDSLKKNRIAYYKVFFEKKSGIRKIEDLRKSYAQLYDSKYKTVAKIPIFKKNKLGMEGATIYLKGLLINNRD